MIKEVCDRCGKEVTHNYVDDRLVIRKTEKNGFFGDVMVGLDSTRSRGVICFDCLEFLLLKALKEEATNVLS